MAAFFVPVWLGVDGGVIVVDEVAVEGIFDVGGGVGGTEELGEVGFVFGENCAGAGAWGGGGGGVEGELVFAKIGVVGLE